MDFLSKKIARLGKTTENYLVVFRPLVLKVNVFDDDTLFQISFKRGPQKDSTKKYKAQESGSGVSMLSIVFDNEEFSRVSGFYKEKDGTFQDKKAKIQVRTFTSIDPQGVKISTVPFNLSDYIGKGWVKESLQLTGNAFYIDFEILVDLDTTGASRATLAPDSRSTMPIPASSNSFATPNLSK